MVGGLGLTCWGHELRGWVIGLMGWFVGFSKFIEIIEFSGSIEFSELTRLSGARPLSTRAIKTFPKEMYIENI